MSTSYSEELPEDSGYPLLKFLISMIEKSSIFILPVRLYLGSGVHRNLIPMQLTCLFQRIISYS